MRPGHILCKRTDTGSGTGTCTGTFSRGATLMNYLEVQFWQQNVLLQYHRIFQLCLYNIKSTSAQNKLKLLFETIKKQKRIAYFMVPLTITIFVPTKNTVKATATVSTLKLQLV